MTLFGSMRVKYLAKINLSTLPEDTDPDCEIHYLDISSVGLGQMQNEPEILTFATAPSRARRLVQDGDTIVSTVRTYLRAVLPIRDPHPSLVVSTGFAVLTPESKIDPRYFAWVIQSDIFIEEVVARSVGVSYPGINASQIGDIQIPITDLQTQGNIADYLNRETARIDSLIEKKRRMVELLELKLECEALQVTQSYGKVESLRRSLNRIQTGTTPSEDFFSFGDTDASIPWITPGDFTARLSAVSISKSLRADAVTSGVIKIHPKDSVLVVGIGATAGRVSMADRSVTSNQQITGLVCLGRLLPRFLAWQLWARRQEVLDTAPYTTLPILNNEFLKSLIIFVPSLEEQEDVATRLDRLASRVGATKERLDNQIARLIELRQALITAAVTGELKIPEVAA